MVPPLKVISSMATRALLAELAAMWRARSPLELAIESVGGVDAARRVQGGEAVDLVVLASNAIDALIDGGHAVRGSRSDLVRSGVSVAVRAGAARPDIGSEDAVREAVLRARTLGYSTGPSGVQLAKLFERWGIDAQVRDRLVQAPPGVPVGELVARGEVELGFQQTSELLHVDGITVLGPLPPAIQIVTVFSAALATASTRADEVRELLAFWTSPATAEAKRRQGMDPA